MYLGAPVCFSFLASLIFLLCDRSDNAIPTLLGRGNEFSMGTPDVLAGSGQPADASISSAFIRAGKTSSRSIGCLSVRRRAIGSSRSKVIWHAFVLPAHTRKKG